MWAETCEGEAVFWGLLSALYTILVCFVAVISVVLLTYHLNAISIWIWLCMLHVNQVMVNRFFSSINKFIDTSSL